MSHIGCEQRRRFFSISPTTNSTPTQQRKSSSLCCRPTSNMHSQERSYAKGIQSIEKLDKPRETEASSEGDTPAASSSDDLSEADYKQVQSLGRAGVTRRSPQRAARCASWRRLPNIRRTTTGLRRLMHGAAQRSLAGEPRHLLDDAGELSQQELSRSDALRRHLAQDAPAAVSARLPDAWSNGGERRCERRTQAGAGAEPALASAVFRCSTAQRHRRAHSP